MARGASITVENAFTRGLITEFTAMNFPEQAVTETDNCVYTEFGEVTRRLGMDYEPEYALLEGIGANAQGAMTEYTWFSVGQNGNTKFVVQQTGFFVRFFFIDQSGSLSAGVKPFSIDMRAHRTAGTTDLEVSSNECRFTSGRGYLFITHPFCNPIYVEYDEDTDTIASRQISIEIRDLVGVDDGLAVDTRPGSLSTLHRYNLLNQGWYFPFRGIPVIQRWQPNDMNFRGTRSDWPSNADIWWLNKRAAQVADGGGESNLGMEIFDSKIADEYTLGNTPAPKGYYIYDAFNIDRSAKIGYSGIPIESAGRSRPSVCSFYAGRVWYAGTQAQKYSSRIYFSQLIERDDQFGNCYQINDPTSETTFDLIDTDGGVLELPLMEKVVAMVPIKDALLIVGTNCIYLLRGTDTGPFRATNYVVEYVSNIGAQNHKSIVVTDTGMIWWSTDGIYLLTPDQVGLTFQVQNLSKPTIQRFIDDVPFANRQYVKGAFNRRDQIVRWIFSDQADSAPYRYNRVLEMNMAGQAFYPYTIDDLTGPLIAGIVVVSGQGLDTLEETVTTIELEDVTTLELEDVVTREQIFIPQPEVFKFLTIHQDDITYSELWRNSYRDWESFSLPGAAYDSYGVSGFRIRGELLRNFNTTPVVFTVRNSEVQANLLVSGIWDYNSRQSMKQELYYKVVLPTIPYILRRVKIRGKGKSLQIMFESVDDAPFYLLGWSTYDHGGTTP